MADSAGDLHTVLTFVELTTVHYQQNDPYGLLNAYITLIPLIIVVGVLTLFIFRRDLRTAAVFGGLVLSESINYVLKKSIKENRPTLFKELKKQSYGMPSSHSQFMFFFATLITLFLLKRRIIISKAYRSITIVSLYFTALLVAYSRYHLYYHTAKQVYFGILVGLILGPLYFLLVEYIFVPYIFPILIDSPIGRYFYLRDTSCIDNIMEFEYRNAMREINNRKSKLNNNKSK